jgi:hypothetical protein
MRRMLAARRDGGEEVSAVLRVEEAVQGFDAVDDEEQVVLALGIGSNVIARSATLTSGRVITASSRS